MPDFSFPPTHRLKRRRLIRPLFAGRRRDDVATLAEGGVRLLWRFAAPEAVGVDTPLQIGFAPGRTRTAVRRNRIRRLLRETYRTRCQHDLRQALQACSRVLTLMAVFRSDPEASPDEAIRRDMHRAMGRLTAHLRSA